VQPQAQTDVSLDELRTQKSVRKSMRWSIDNFRYW